MKSESGTDYSAPKSIGKILIVDDDPALRDNEEPLEPGDLDLGLAPRPDSLEE